MASTAPLMGVPVDIFRSWRHPRQVMRDRLVGGIREDRAVAYLLMACALIFVGQWPALMGQTEVVREARFAGSLFAWLFVVPLAMYLIAAISHILARVFGGHGSWFSARMALFWSLLSVAPAWVASGVLSRLINSQSAANVVGALAFLLFVVIWVASLIEAESRGQAHEI